MRDFRASRRGRASRIALHLEVLEDRHLMSGTPAALPAVVPAPDASSTDYDQASILVRFRPEMAAGRTGSSALAGTTVGPALAELLVPGLYEVRLDPGVDVPTALAAYQADPTVAYAEPNFQVHTTDTIPNDPRWSSMWHMTRVRAPAAWDYWIGGGGIVVASIDTGVDYNHPDLRNNVWYNPTDGSRGYNFVNNTANPLDDNGHGSHTSGTIGAEGYNAVGVVGVNWYTQIMALKTLNAAGSGSLSWAISALNYAVNNGALVSNNSYGCTGCFSSAFQTAIQNAAGYGHIFVAAAGNSGRSSPDYPAAYASAADNVIAVAATTSSDGLASFSNYGANTVHLGAPGASILSTWRNGGYSTVSGTSMASPMVAGAVALIYDYFNYYYGLVPYQDIINQIVWTVDRVPALQGRTISGGRLNVARAIGAISAPGTGGGSGGLGVSPTFVVDALADAPDTVLPVPVDTGDDGVIPTLHQVFVGGRPDEAPVFVGGHAQPQTPPRAPELADATGDEFGMDLVSGF